jgi:hypothetical protein
VRASVKTILNLKTILQTLPNYFLADLPPEAVLSPRIITEAIETLRRNREKFLMSRTTENIVSVLSEVAVEWLRPENKFRKLALEHGPAETGFSRAILEKGLDGFFSQCTPENFQALLEQDLGHGQRLDGLMTTGAEEKSNRTSMVHGPVLLVHIAAGNLPNPALMSLVLGLLTRSAQFMKCASGASLLPRLFAHSVYELDRKLGACMELAEWHGGNADLEPALFAEADCVTATGSDETLAEIRRRLLPKTRFLGYGQRVSFGYVTREVLREETIAGVVSQAADDVIAWDQNGCLSPHVLYVEERGMVESDKFAELLALELMRREDAEPRGKISTAEAAMIASRRAMCEVLAAHRADVKIWQSRNSTAWTVVFEHETRFQFSCLNRFIYVKPVPDLNAVWQGADSVRGSLSTVGIAAPPEKLKETALSFARWGAPRVCPLGRMQQPPLTWRHDGRPALGDLVVWTDFEL